MPVPEQGNYVSSNLFMVGDSQQGLAKLNSSTTEPLDSLHPRDYEIDTEPSQISKLSENPCSMANDAPNKSPERAKDSGIANVSYT